MIFPEPLKPGAVVAVVAPSSPFEHALAWRGLGFLGDRYRLRFDRNGLLARQGYLAGHDARRRAEIERAMRDPDVRAIVAARGGYGANRFAHSVDFSGLRADPKWIVGFSDITAIHAELAGLGVASMHAAHVTSLGRADARTRSTWIDAMERPLAQRAYGCLRTLVPGRASGTLTGGNLTMLHACAAAGRLVFPEGAIVFLEDVTERPYRIDRTLTTLIVGGHFRGVRGFILGDFTDCAPGPDGVRVEDVLAERLSTLGVPIAAGLRTGHGIENEPLVLGAPAAIEASPSGARFRVF